MIGYYAHSHGSGHCNYADIMGRIFGNELTVFTDRDHRFSSEVDVVKLENENPDGTEFDRNVYAEPRALHYAPVNMRKIARRNRSILDAIVQMDIRLLIIDVSVEVAMLARVSSIPYAYVRLQGDRGDLPHLNAYEGASFLIAYFPENMESPTTPFWVRKKTVYLGFVSKFSFDTTSSRRPAEYPATGRPVLLRINGFGGSAPMQLDRLHLHYDIYSIGPDSDSCECSEFVRLGVVDCTRAFIEHADVIIASCGANMTSEILTLQKRFVAVPEKRPYGEQEHMAKNLRRTGLAIDISDYASTFEAVGAVKGLQGRLTSCSGREVLGFRDMLRAVGYRADLFLRCSGTESGVVGRGYLAAIPQMFNVVKAV